MKATKSILQHVYDHEEAWRDRVYLTQPVGGDRVEDYTWGRVLDEARRMATHLRGMGLEKGDRVAMLSKNCAHFFIAELAIWIGGFTTVAIFPTESADTIRYVLEHSEAKVLFVGKLDTWHQQEGVPDGDRASRSRSHPKTGFPRPGTPREGGRAVEGRVDRDPDDLAMLIYTSGSTGQPKGVMHSFGRISVAAEGIVKGVEFSENERVLSYLPLAHVFERAYIECASLVAGGHIFFAEALDTFVKDLKRAQADALPLGAAPVAQVPAGRLREDAAQGARLPPLDPDREGDHRKKVLTGLGLEHVRLAGSGLGADPRRAHRVVPQARPQPPGGLRDERGLRVLAPLDGPRSKSPATSASRTRASR
jgi:long-chain acyl-CoA synthetase